MDSAVVELCPGAFRGVAGVVADEGLEGLRDVVEDEVVGGLGHGLALGLHDVLDGDVAVVEDLEVVRDEVPVVALGTLDHDGAVVVRLLGDGVGGAVVALLAREGQHVLRLVHLDAADVLGVGGSVLRRGVLRRSVLRYDS